MFELMIKNRSIPFAKLGMKVSVEGRMGTIVGFHGLNLAVYFDGEYNYSNCHPHWKVTYYDDNMNIIADTF